MTMINSYFSVPLATLQAIAVPNQAVPEECFEKHVLPFLSTKMVGLYGIGLDEFESLRTISVKVNAEKGIEEEDEKRFAQEALYYNNGTNTNNNHSNQDDESSPLL